MSVRSFKNVKAVKHLPSFLTAAVWSYFIACDSRTSKGCRYDAKAFIVSHIYQSGSLRYRDLFYQLHFGEWTYIGKAFDFNSDRRQLHYL